MSDETPDTTPDAPPDVPPPEAPDAPTAEAPAAEAEPDAVPPETAAEEAAAEAPPAPAEEPLPEVAAMLLERLQGALGEGIVEHGQAFGDLVVRVTPEVWVKAAELARDKLHCDYLSFISGIDWSPAPRPGGDSEGDTSAPVQPTEMTFGVAGSAGRFQVFARVQSTTRHHGFTLKVDVDEADPRVPSWVPVYPGADWHERECWEMFGVTFDGHPALRHLFLPFEFEGHPLRKDFPLLAREIKPWPGLVDVEPMPGDEPAEAEASAGGGE